MQLMSVTPDVSQVEMWPCVAAATSHRPPRHAVRGRSNRAVVHDVAREAARRHTDTVQRRGLGRRRSDKRRKRDPAPIGGARVLVADSGSRGSTQEEAEENYHRGAAIGLGDLGESAAAAKSGDKRESKTLAYKRKEN